MSYKDRISSASVRILNKSIRKDDKRWADIRPYIDAHGTHVVVDLFEQWASSLDKRPEYPLSYFLGAIEGLINSQHVPAATVEQMKIRSYFDDLTAELYGINPNQAFTGNDLKALTTLLALYTREEIIEGYKEYTSKLDDFELRRAARTFAQGGATAVILAGRKYKAERKRQEELLEIARKQFEQTPAIPQEPEEEFFVPE